MRDYLRERDRSTAARSGMVSRLKTWADAADAGETRWAARRSPIAKVASWSLVVLLMVGAYISRANLGVDVERTILLTTASAGALSLAIGSLRRASVPPVIHTGILTVFLLGGIFQLYLFSYNLFKHPTFITDQAPFNAFVRSSDVAHAYGLITVGFVVFCALVTVLEAIPIMIRFPRYSTLRDGGRLFPVLIVATLGYGLFTGIQIVFGIGQAALYNPTLPFHLVALTLFYQRWLYPALLLLGIWVYDRRDPKLSYVCLIATGVVAAVQAYGATSRGAIFSLGIPVIFVWIFTGRFTRFRKLLVIGAFAIYLIVAPILTSIRVARVTAASGAILSPTSAPTRRPISVASLDFELGHVAFRVGGAGSMLLAIRNEQRLSLAGLIHVYRPSGLTSYFTHDVVGVPVSSTVADSQAPTLIGLGTLVGGGKGLIVVLILTVLSLEFASRWIARRLQTWPVALAILGYAALTFFSEGVPIEFYKAFLAIGFVEFLYRQVALQRAGALASDTHGTPSSPDLGV